MITFLTNLALIVVLLIFIVVLYLLLLWMWGNIRAKVPFVSVPNQTLKDIEKALDLKEGSVVCDLGCGDGRVLFYLYKNNKNSRYIGVDNSSFPIILAKVRNFFHKRKNKSNIQIIKDDFFNMDLSSVTHVFTYLYPNMMDDLLPKLERELKPGSRLVSMSFHFTTKREKELIDLKRGKYQIAKNIYVYEF